MVLNWEKQTGNKYTILLNHSILSRIRICHKQCLNVKDAKENVCLKFKTIHQHFRTQTIYHYLAL